MMNGLSIYTVICAFVSDIIQEHNTTNEKYYACEEYLRTNKDHLTDDETVLLKDILTKANQLMWVNLTLDRAQLSAEKRDDVGQKKAALVEWFARVNDEVHERKKDINH